MDLSGFPRLSLAHLPTPLEPLDRLSERFGGPRIFIKRDDCTGLATGGNKTRKLEFLLGQARVDKADTVITQGGLQSNHVRQTAAAAARLGLHCHVLLECLFDTQAYTSSGNMLLNALLGARVHLRAAGTDMEAALDELAQTLRDEGGRAYSIAAGGSTPVGALGYVNCADELIAQIDALGLGDPLIVLATGSAGTQAGLLVGFAAHNRPLDVLGVCVSRDRESQEQKVYDLALRTAEHVGFEGGISRQAVVAVDDYVGEGYGMETPQMKEAVGVCARSEGILLDPVYTGKAMAGLIDMIRNGRIGRDRPAVFLHTGGAPALFAYDPMV